MAPRKIKPEKPGAGNVSLILEDPAEPISSGDTLIMDEEFYSKPTSGKPEHTSDIDTPNHHETGSHNMSFPATENGLNIMYRGAKELIQAVQAIRHLGVEEKDLPLPKIVVVGDQSTGKSSLIEAMSEIKVPRHAGTCTRCPMEINLAESDGENDDWECKVLLMKKYSYTGNLECEVELTKKAARLEGATRKKPLGPWEEQKDVEIYEFATIDSKDKIEKALKLAQLAILNPSENPAKYMPQNQILGKEPKEHKVKFSPNVIRLDITGPGLPNLSFYDLPGVINVVEDAAEAYLVPLVRNLVKKYIEAEDCINLLALTMTDDLQNSSAFSLVKEVEAEARTMGCLTKPDRMQQGESLEQWTQVLSGKRFELGFGYHVIKNNHDASVDHAVAREEEENFFAYKKPWATTLKTHANRFGTLLLQTALSERLEAQIRASLPRIAHQIQEKASRIDAQLDQLPMPEQGNLPMKIYRELHNFESVMEKHFDDESDEVPFQYQWDKVARIFRSTMAKSQPKIKPNRPSQDPPSVEQSGTPTPSRNSIQIELSSDDDEPMHELTPTKGSGKKRLHPSTPSTPSKFARTTGSTPRPLSAKWSSKQFTYLEIRDIMREAYVGGLPSSRHPKAIERMIKLSVSHWGALLDMFLDKTGEMIQNAIFDLVQRIFGKRKQTKFYEKLYDICGSFLEETLAQHSKLIKRILEWELQKPTTLNERDLDFAHDRALGRLQDDRRRTRVALYVRTQEMKGGKPLSEQVKAEKLKKSMTDAELGGPDEYSKEVEAMADVQGYYECAYSRFVDIVCESVHFEIFFTCRNKLVKAMREEFCLEENDADERCAVLLAIKPDDALRRVQLQKEKDTVQKAKERLEALYKDELYN